MQHHPPRTSELLAAIPAAYEGERISFAELIAALRNRAFGITLLLFGIPNCLPMPPGVPVICGTVLMLAAVPMILGYDHLWIPAWIGRRTIARSDLDRIIGRAVPLVQRFERMSRPRLEMFSGRTARRVVGAVVAFLGFVLVLPIPFLGNMPPGVAVCVFGLGLVERDGLIILGGFFATVLAMTVTVAMTWAIIAGAGWLF